MAAVQLSQIPSTLLRKKIASSDTNQIDVVAESPGQVVRVWGLLLAGGTSIRVFDDATDESGVLTVSGLSLPMPRGNRADCAFPYWQSTVGKTIKITPGASGLNGWVFYTQD